VGLSARFSLLAQTSSSTTGHQEIISLFQKWFATHLFPQIVNLIILFLDQKFNNAMDMFG